MILALMPLGVEHLILRLSLVLCSPVILALMPLGVEHSHVILSIGPTQCDPRIDAVRR